MGFFDRLVPKPSAKAPAPPPPASADDTLRDAPVPEADAPGDASAAPAGNLVPQLAAARELLDHRDIDGARAIYEQVLTLAGDRPDVLVTISGDLGSCGYLEPIVELVGPRYDAERHGPATGLNLLQAYLALGNPEAAQHVLDVLFALERPDLEERLWGFSNAIAELIEARKRGGPGTGAPARQIELVTISKPIWAYGLESLPELLPDKSGPVRKVAFAQLATPGLADAGTRMAAPEDALGRFSRGLPLWLAETMYLSHQYQTAAALGFFSQAHYALFPAEWTTDNIRQLIESGGRFDYVLTGAVQEQSGDFALVLRLWEIKSFRERKRFEAQWTPSTADAALAKLHEQLRLFFEWKPAPGPGLRYAAPASPTAWIDLLGASLSLFLADKNLLPKEQLAPLPECPTAEADEAAALAHLTLTDRARRVGVDPPPATPLFANSLVEQARAALGL